MSTLAVRRLTPTSLADVIDDGPDVGATITDAHRHALAARFRAVAIDRHRRLDAWSVERAGRGSPPFRWSPATARRLIGNAALGRVADGVRTPRLGVELEIADLRARAETGRTRPGSLGSWLADRHPAELAVVHAAAADWATTLAEIGAGLGTSWRVARADAYYDVERARTTLRARRDLIVATDAAVVRVRGGHPSSSAGAGLRADLVAATFARADGRAPRRYVGVWPDAGLVVAVDGSMENLRAGARDLVRTAVVQRRQWLRAA